MIRLTRVTKEYPPRGRALDDVSFHIRKGEFAFITGHSGSGKSTTLRLVHMSERPTDGEVRVSGFSSARTSDRDVWKLRRRVGYVFQDFSLLPGRTAGENVAFALEVTGAPRQSITPRVQRLLSQVGLSAKFGASIEELSGGEQQRVAIARALANDPLVLLADEPTGNLDERATRSILDLFKQINAMGMAILMATHDLQMVRDNPDVRLLELAEGRLVYDSNETAGPSPLLKGHDARLDQPVAPRRAAPTATPRVREGG